MSRFTVFIWGMTAGMLFAIIIVVIRDHVVIR